MVFGLILRVNDDVIMNFSGSITKECRLYDAYPWCGLAYPRPKLIQVVDCGKCLNHTEYMYLRYDLRPRQNLKMSFSFSFSLRKSHARNPLVRRDRLRICRILSCYHCSISEFRQFNSFKLVRIILWFLLKKLLKI